MDTWFLHSGIEALVGPRKSAIPAIISGASARHRSINHHVMSCHTIPNLVLAFWLGLFAATLTTAAQGPDAHSSSVPPMPLSSSGASNLVQDRSAYILGFATKSPSLSKTCPKNLPTKPSASTQTAISAYPSSADRHLWFGLRCVENGGSTSVLPDRRRRNPTTLAVGLLDRAI
jgi:hypothetical protein